MGLSLESGVLRKSALHRGVVRRLCYRLWTTDSRLFASDLHGRAVVLAVDTEVDVGAEAHAECVRWHFDSLDDRRAATVEEHDLERGEHVRISKQIGLAKSARPARSADTNSSKVS